MSFSSTPIKTKPGTVGPLLLLLMLCLSLLFPGHIASASESAEGGWGMWETVGKVFNLALVVGVLVYFLKKPFCDFFENQRIGIRKEIEEARAAKEEAESKLAEMEKRMAGLSAELEEVHTMAQKEAGEERDRILAQAEKDAATILDTTRKEADALVRAGRMELKEYAAQLAVDLAAEKIIAGMDSNLQNRMVDRFADKLKTLS